MAKYLDKNDKEEMLEFQRLINDHLTIAAALRERLQRWFQGRLEKYKLDPQVTWSLDTKTGQIKEKKETNEKLTGNHQ